MRVLLDSNFLMIPGKFKVDVFRELENFGRPELFTIDLVISELRGLASGKGRDALHARLALALVDKKGVRILKSGGKDADAELEKLASGRDFMVCTQDRALQERLKKEGVAVIFLRQKKLLARF